MIALQLVKQVNHTIRKSGYYQKEICIIQFNALRSFSLQQIPSGKFQNSSGSGVQKYVSLIGFFSCHINHIKLNNIQLISLNPELCNPNLSPNFSFKFMPKLMALDRIGICEQNTKQTLNKFILDHEQTPAHVQLTNSNNPQLCVRSWS